MTTGGPIDFLARRLWWLLMWFMRRSPIKRLRQNWPQWVPEKRRAAAWAHFRQQEAWARDHGLAICRLCVLVVVLSLGFQFCWWLVFQGIERGWLPWLKVE